MPRVDEYLATYSAQQPKPAQARLHHQSICKTQISLPTQSQPANSRQSSQPSVSKPSNSPTKAASGDEVTHSGPMKKRKTKLLRHEWHEHHFTLKGTRLAMHKDASALETLEYIDVDDYAIACSSLASGSKLNAAFKAMNISRNKNSSWDNTTNGKKGDEAAFAFQLIPAALEKGARLKKRESTMVSAGATPSEGKDAGKGGKTHYFAVRSRDDRIDWMRELMLAKALKQKSEGFEINVNGNMI